LNTNRFFLTILLVLFCSLALQAQITGDLKGTVTDPAGSSVPSAKITVTSKATGETRTVITDAMGQFAVNQLKIGTYEVKAEAAGFRVAITQALTRSGETAVVVFKMEIGAITESVVVTDAVSALDTNDAQIQVSIQGENIQELPVARNPLLFAIVAPGVVPVSANNPFLSTGSYNSNGSRGRSNNITIDNITSSDISTTGNGGGQINGTSFSSIQEVKLITNNFSAEYGRNSGSQLLFVTKSGSNTFHAEIYEFLQNDKLNARSFFDDSGKADLIRQNQFGFTFGGPIIRNKTHFFGSYEGLELRGASAPVIANTPTDAQRAAVTDPTSKKLLDQYQLPKATRISSDGTGQVTQSASSFTKAPLAYSIRIDHQFSKNDTMTGRFSRYSDESGGAGNTFIGSNFANFGAVAKTGVKNANISETHLFTPAVVNEFRFGFGRSAVPFAIDSTVPLGPRIQFSDASIDTFGVWNGLPQGRTQNTFQWADTLTWARGAHNIKAGADVYRYRLNSWLDSSVRGLYTFNTWDDFAAGTPTQWTQNFGSTLRGTRVTNQQYFVQDDWKIRPNFTLNLGLRVEHAGPISEVNGLTSNLNLNCTNSLGAAGSGPLGCFVLGQPSTSPHTDWGPRLGFAWNPFKDLKTVVRGGYGIAYDFLYLNLITNQRTLPPLVASATLSGISSFTGANSFANLVAGTSAIQQSTAAQVGKLSATVLNYGNVSPTMDGNLRPPMVQQWSFGLEREAIRHLVLKLTYVGTKGDHLQRSHQINTINDSRAIPATSVTDETAKLSGYLAAQSALSGNATRAAARLDPRFNVVTLVDSSASSLYHALQFTMVKELSRGLYGQVAYTYGKSIDNGSDALGVLVNDSPTAQNPNNLRADRGPSEFDVRQRLVITHTWEPTYADNISNKVVRQIARGWGFAGISSFRTGFPVNLTTGSRRGITTIPLNGIGSYTRPNVTGGPINFQPQPSGSAGAPSGTAKPDGVQSISTYATSLGLSQPLIGNFGSLGRNVVRANGAVNFDWNIYRKFHITERMWLQFRAEGYNMFNNVSFQTVNANISSASFGQYTDTFSSSRYFQVGARLVF
jgi:hypothetical protein